MTIEPFHKLRPDVQAVWDIILPKLMASEHADKFLPVDAFMLEQLCDTYVLYRRLRDELRDRLLTEASLRSLTESCEEFRLLVRELLAEFLVLRHERVRLNALTPAGEDADIAYWFGELEETA